MFAEKRRALGYGRPAHRRADRIVHPRRDAWRLHFRWDGVRVVGTTPTGRATVMALHMNRPLALVIREEEAQRGRHPSQTHR